MREFMRAELLLLEKLLLFCGHSHKANQVAVITQKTDTKFLHANVNVNKSVIL